MSLFVGDTPLKAAPAHSDYCLSDCWRFSTKYDAYEGIVQGAFVNRFSMAGSVEFDYLPGDIFPHVFVNQTCRQEADLSVCSGDGWWLAVAVKPAQHKCRFGVAISYSSEDEAIERAQAACTADLSDVCDLRMDYYRTIAPPDWLAGSMLCTYYKAVSIQKAAIESPQHDMVHPWSLPVRLPSACTNTWDSLFHALGLQHNVPHLAFDTIRTLTSRQSADGAIPLLITPGMPTDSHTVHPPLLAWVITHLCERTMQIEFLDQMYPRLVRYADWFSDNRRHDNGLYGWRLDTQSQTHRGQESGMGDSPRFDSAAHLTAVDLSSYMACEFFSLEKIARCLDKSADAQHWRQRRMETAELLNTLLWDDEDRFYYDLDEYGEFIRVKTTAGFTPLLGLVPDRDRAEAMRVHLMNANRFWSPVPVCSVSQDEPTFSGERWRGSAHCSVNILIYYGLLAYGFLPEARRLARATLTEIMRGYLQSGCMYEHYDPNGASFGAVTPAASNNQTDYHLTAAAYVHLAHELGQ